MVSISCLSNISLKRSVVLGLSTLLCACATPPPVKELPWFAQHKDACLPEAAVMAENLRKAGLKARVLIMTTPEFGHSVCIYQYPLRGQTRLWAWDSKWGSNEIRRTQTEPFSVNNPKDVAKKWLAFAYPQPSLNGIQLVNNNDITSAEFAEPKFNTQIARHTLKPSRFAFFNECATIERSLGGTDGKTVPIGGIPQTSARKVVGVENKQNRTSAAHPDINLPPMPTPTLDIGLGVWFESKE